MTQPDSWDIFAETVAVVETARRELDEARVAAVPPPGWPWRASKKGNVVDVRGQPILRMPPDLPRSLRRRMAQQQVDVVRAGRAALEQRLLDAEARWNEVRPAEPGSLLGVYEVADLSRVTAAQFAEAFNRHHETAGVATARPSDTGSGIILTFDASPAQVSPSIVAPMFTFEVRP